MKTAVSPIKIRPAVEDDADGLSEMIIENARALLQCHYSVEQWNTFIGYYSPEAMRNKIATQQVFCAVRDNRIVGTIALHHDFVVGFYTRLDEVKHGIGKMMMQHLETVALEEGLTEIQLASSPEGLGFYLRHGWIKIKDMVIEYNGVGFEETLMLKKLT